MSAYEDDTPMPPSGNGWGEWKHLVLQRLEDNHRQVSQLSKDFNDFRVALAQYPALHESQEGLGARVDEQAHELKRHGEHIADLRVRASLFGAIAGLVATLAIRYFFK